MIFNFIKIILKLNHRNSKLNYCYYFNRLNYYNFFYYFPKFLFSHLNSINYSNSFNRKIIKAINFFFLNFLLNHQILKDLQILMYRAFIIKIISIYYFDRHCYTNIFNFNQIKLYLYLSFLFNILMITIN